MMTDSFLTIQTQTSGLYKSKGSKFLSFAHPAKDTEVVKDLIADYKKQYHNARHICYAYVLGPEREDYRFNDDGEPSGTAGRPILGQINARNLTDVLVVVVRYFGGVLLGTGGLVTAYKEAASDALEQAEIIEKTVDSCIKISFEYPDIETIMSAIKASQAEVIRQDFQETCILKLSVPLAYKSFLINSLEKVAEIEVLF